MIDEEAALRIAKQRCSDKGWGFSQPIDVSRRRGWFGQNDRFEIESNAGKLGTKARFVVDAVSGEILSEKYIAR